MYVPLTRVMSAVLHPHFMFVVGALQVNDHYGLALDSACAAVRRAVRPAALDARQSSQPGSHSPR